MGVVNPPSSVLFGANNTGNNLENGMINSDGSYNKNDGAKNYIPNATLENQVTTGWTLGVTGALTNGLPTATPTFGSGASGTLALAIVTSNQLSGTASLSYADSAITTAGNMVASSALTIDIEDQAKVLTWKFSYKAQTNPTNGNWSGTSSNSFAVAVYDVTNSSWLSSAGNFNIVQSSGVGICTGTCQTNSTTASIRFVIYNANASAGAITMYFDSFYLGPQTSPQAPVITDWVAYTPTFVGLGTVGATNVKSRRVGDSIEVVGNVVSGISTGTTASMTVGYNGANANIVVDTSKVAPGAIVGMAGQSGSTTTYFGESVLAPASNLTTVNFGSQTSTTSLLTNVVGSSLVATAGTLAFEFKVPIVGWSSNSVSSADTDTRVVSFHADTTTTGTIGSSVAVQILGYAASIDTHGAFNSGAQTYLIPVSGKYFIRFNQYYTSVATAGVGTIQSRILVNGSTVYNEYNPSGLTTASNRGGSATTTLNLKAGDSIQVAAFQDTGTTLTFVGGGMGWDITRLSGPAVINATESVNGTYTDTAGGAIGTGLATYTYATKVKDTHNAYSGGTLTIPVSGQYRFFAGFRTAGVTLTTAQVVQCTILKNGVTLIGDDLRNGNGSASNIYQLTTTAAYPCNAGDTIVVQPISNVATTMSTTAGVNFFSWERVGN